MFKTHSVFTRAYLHVAWRLSSQNAPPLVPFSSQRDYKTVQTHKHTGVHTSPGTSFQFSTFTSLDACFSIRLGLPPTNRKFSTFTSQHGLHLSTPPTFSHTNSSTHKQVVLFQTTSALSCIHQECTLIYTAAI